MVELALVTDALLRSHGRPSRCSRHLHGVGGTLVSLTKSLGIAPLLVVLIACGASGSSSSPSPGGGGGGDGGPDSSSPNDDGGTGIAPACNQPFGKSAPIVLAKAPLGATGGGNPPGLTWTGSVYAAAWADAAAGSSTNTPVRFTTIDPVAGKSTPPAEVAATGFGPVIAATTNGFEVLYATNQNDQVNALRIDVSGMPTGAPTVVAGDPNGEIPVAALGAGGAVLAVWQGIHIVGHAIIGAPQPPQFRGISDAIGGPSNIVWAGDRFAFAWRGYHVGPAGVYLAEVGLDGNPGTLVTVWPDAADTDTDNEAYRPGNVPSLAWTGTEYRLAWTAFGTKLFTARVPRGGPADAPQSSAFNASTLRSTSPVWDGTSYGAVVADGGGIAFARFDASGARTSDPTLPIASTDLYASLLHNGREYAVAWSSPKEVAFARFGTCP